MSRANKTREAVTSALEGALEHAGCRTSSNVVAFVSGYLRREEPRIADLLERALELDNDPRFASLLKSDGRGASV